VRWFTPASPTTVHGEGDHLAAAVVRGLEEMLRAVVVNWLALSDACPWTVRLAAFEVAARVWNCT
jgi:hypothetical protein